MAPFVVWQKKKKVILKQLENFQNEVACINITKTTCRTDQVVLPAFLNKKQVWRIPGVCLWGQGNLWCQEGDISNVAMLFCEELNSLKLLIAVKDFHSSSKPSAFTFYKLWKKDSKQFTPIRDVCQYSQPCSVKLWLLLTFKQGWTLHLWVGGTYSMWESEYLHVSCRNVHASYNKSLKKIIIMLTNLHWQRTFSRLNSYLLDWLFFTDRLQWFQIWLAVNVTNFKSVLYEWI